MVRIAIINKEKCSPSKCNSWCLKMCPVNRADKECIVLSENKARINEELCTGCGICVRCPFNAIKIINLPEKLTEKAIHRFGPNAFELFRLPLIKEKSVVGILGRNGIGKTTALNILAGNIEPNLENYKNPPTEKEIIEHFKHTYLQEYFKKLFDKRIKISYKPQRIELLPEYYKGRVINLIKKIDEKNQGEKLLKELNLFELKNRNISELSGGELQRLAIIAAAIKKADIYYFDEPASFCDVTQRIKVAKLIRNLAKNASVLVVEHDLATLDYISDEIQIVYGEPAAYGVISQSKGVRRGINEYLDGFLPEDNVRFRDYAIKFHTPHVNTLLQQEVLLEFPELEKNFKTFKLKVNPGTVHKGEVLTIMGANGLGKSTFLNILAGKLKPTKGKIKKLKISYKEQYPKPIKLKVKEFLEGIAKEEFNSGWYKQNILQKLNLHKIQEHLITNLSGGELQKVMIAACLSEDAEIFALDEPSAFIDVEDRLKVAEVIKEFTQKKEVCAIVVDHDVQLVDYLGDSMLVFEGTPGKLGSVYGPCSKREGMNRVLKMLNITYRKDPHTHRPRINKPNSQLDKQQRAKGEYYYS